EIGVCNCGFAAALAITCRTGGRPSALWSDLDPASGINPRDAAAAVADFDNVHHRQHHRMTRNISTNIVATCDFRMKVFDETRLGGGSTHVEGDDAPAPGRSPEMGCGTHPPPPPRPHHRPRLFFPHLSRHHTAVRLHDTERATETGVAKPFLQRDQVATDDRTNI